MIRTLLLDYPLLTVPITVLVLAQVLKVLGELANGRFAWHDLWGYGGMPSSHAALVSSLATAAGLAEGWASASFAIAAILAVVVIRDALGLRWQLGQHSQALNRLIQELPDQAEYKFPVLTERVGHTAGQVVAGALLGAIATWVILTLA